MAMAPSFPNALNVGTTVMAKISAPNWNYRANANHRPKERCNRPVEIASLNDDSAEKSLA